MRMRNVTVGRIVVVAGVLLLSACASITSQTSIEPGKAFRLGGGQAGAFTVRGSNSGAVPVVVFLDRDGVRDSVTTVAPGQKVDATFPSRAMAVFVNRSDTKAASLSVKITGSVSSLGMTYEANKKK